ncbi:hypothetical protein SapgrDRAFT_1642 [Saprospira grandis DSM 2844]|uniref:Uncharacterized protein n=1 Tax=Saprospira grandis DSM 2844 TaxID=694433 RepID=J0P0N6_9BACT|nr:hypothetical protein SapgrDRAFT_1642 [Saprospira grandis DSM 2844]
MAAIIAQAPHYGDFRLFLIYFPWHNQLTICQFYFYLTAILGPPACGGRYVPGLAARSALQPPAAALVWPTAPLSHR